MSDNGKIQSIARTRATSLGNGIIIPVFVAALLLFTGLLVISNYTSSQRALEIQKSEAHTIAHSITYAAQTVPNLEQLNRFVTSLGGHTQIKSIHVIDDHSDTIVASTDFLAQNSTVSKFRTLSLSPIDRAILELAPENFHNDEQFETLSFCESIDLSRCSPESIDTRYGRVVVTIDRRVSAQQVADFSHLNTAIAALCVLLMLASILAILKKHVLVPLKSIEDGLDSHFKSNIPFKKPELPNNEIGQLATMLESTFATIISQNEKAKALTRDLQFQKDTLDYHAIVSETDADGSIAYANEAFCEISGYSWDEIIGENHRILNSSLHPIEFWKHMYREVLKKGFWRGEVRNKAKDGSFYWANTSIAAFKNEEGNIERFVSIHTDITALKEAEFKMLKANADIEHSLELAKKARLEAEHAANAKTQFLATMSHEIRTPMNGLIGVLHLIEDDLPPEKVTLLKTAKNSADDLLVLINDILDFSKIDAGKMELESIQFDGLELLESVCDLHASTAHNNQLDLIVESAPHTDYKLLGDPVRIRQIVSNLIGNALKFTKHGFVTAAIELTESSYRITIKDTGIGIKSENVEILFNSFTQENSSTSRKFGGTGLGLSICKKLVNLMDGEIWVESVLGQGSSFIFELPRSGAIPNRQINPIEKSLHNKNALLVQPDSHSKKYLETYLQHLGINTFVWGDEAGTPTHFDYVFLEGQRVPLVQELWQSIKPQIALSEKHVLILMSGMGADDPEDNLKDKHKTLRKPLKRNKLLGTLCSRDTLVVEKPSEPADRQRFANLKVLVVDDNFTNRLIVSKIMMQRHGIEADLASSGIEAIQKLGSSRYDLVFMDCMMPDMDGYTATQRIREGKAGQENIGIPIIALTANVMSDDREKCENAGMDDYLSKPVDPTDIARTLEKWTTKKRAPKTVPSPLETDIPILDLDKINSVYRGDFEAINEMLEIFDECMEDNLNLLHQSITFADTKEDLRFYAHRIRGSAAEIGANRLSLVSQEMEELCLENKLDEAAALYPNIRDAATRVQDAISSYRSSIQQS